jgi:hypothetical protein
MRLVVLSLMLATVAHATDLTVCGQTLHGGEIGELVADLDCGGAPVVAVTMQAGSTLHLNGHGLTGAAIGVGTDPGKKGGPVTRITGPGEITGMTSCAISSSNKVSLQSVDLHDNGCGIMSVYTFPITLEDVSITANTGDGITYLSTVGNGRIKGEHVTVSDNGGSGLRSSGKITLEDAVVTGNTTAGVVSTAKSIQVRNGTLTGNGSGGDVASLRRSRLVDSTCDHSVDLRNGGSLGICALD